jgi:hypothetical protein
MEVMPGERYNLIVQAHFYSKIKKVMLTNAILGGCKDV